MSPANVMISQFRKELWHACGGLETACMCQFHRHALPRTFSLVSILHLEVYMCRPHHFLQNHRRLRMPWALKTCQDFITSEALLISSAKEP